MTIEKRLNHRDGRIPSRIDCPTTVTEILITLTDQVEEPLAWQNLPFLPADITTYGDRKGWWRTGLCPCLALDCNYLVHDNKVIRS